jgi:UDP-glucose 4-epimerase
MRVVVVGATGNVGTSLVRALSESSEVDSILGVARRRPELAVPKTDWATADIATDDLAPIFRGADCVVHLAWLIQPSRDLAQVERVNVAGSSRLFRAVSDSRVRNLVYASSVGTYSQGPKSRFVAEDWPVDGIGTSYYSRQKAEVERVLDAFELEHPQTRVVRLRPGLVFKREAASGIRRLFVGPFLPRQLVQPRTIPVFPAISGLRFQAVHSNDVGQAYRLAVTGDARGAFNIAAAPVLDSEKLAELLGARLVSMPPRLARRLLAIAWRARLTPIPEGWFDLAVGVPLMDTTRAERELGWTPQHGADEAFLELVHGIRDDAGAPTPPLSPGTGGPARIRELLTGVGRRSGA